MAPTRRSTRSADPGAVETLAASSPFTRITRARPVAKPNSPVTKPRARATRKTASKTQAAPQVEEEEEEEEQEEEQEEKPKPKSTRKATLKSQVVPEVANEGAVISQEKVESAVAAATRRSTRATSIASLQSPAKSKAVRGRVAKKVAPMRRTRGAAEASDGAVSNADGEDPTASKMATRRGRKQLVGTITSTAPVIPVQAFEGPTVVVKVRSRRGGMEESKNVIENPVVSKSTVDATTPSWAKRRGGGRAKAVEDAEAVGESVDQQIDVGGMGARAAKAEIVENIETIVKGTNIKASGPEPVVVKGKGHKKGKMVGAITETVEPESVIANGKGKGIWKGKRVGFAIEVPELTAKDKVVEPEPITKGRRSRRGTKTEVIEVHRPASEDIDIEVAEPEPAAARGKGRKKGKKVDAIAEEPEVIVGDTGDELAGPEPVIAKGRGRKTSKKAAHDVEIAEINAEQQTGSINPAAVEDNEVIAEEVGESVAAKGRGRRKGKKVDIVVEEPEAIVEDTNDELAGPEPVIAKERGRKRGRRVVQDVKMVGSNGNQETEVDAETEIMNIDTVAEATAEQPEPMIEGIGIETTEPVAKGRGRKKGKKAAPTRRNTRKGQRVTTEVPGTEMSDIDVVQTQQTEADVDTDVAFSAEQTSTVPTVKDSGVFLEDEPIVEKPVVESLKSLAEKTGTETVVEGSKVIVQESNIVADEALVIAIQPEVIVGEIETKVTTREVVGAESKLDAEHAEAVVAKSLGQANKKQSPKGKEKTVPIENAEVGEPPVEGERFETGIGLEPEIEKLSTDIENLEAKSGQESSPTSDVNVGAQDIVSDFVEDGVQQTEIEGVIVEQEEVFEEVEDEPDLPPPFSSPAAKLTIILSPRRTTPDPDLDPIKTPVPSSPSNSRMSHPLNSSPLRQSNPDTLVLASPPQVTTPRNSPSKKRSTPSARTPISCLSESSTAFGRKLEDSRDVNVSSISTPARGQNMGVGSSPIMMPPATPDAVAGDARSPTKQTPTKESEAVGDVVIGEAGEHSLLAASIANINPSPVKNSSPIKAAPEAGKSTPVGRLSFGGSEVPQSSPLVGRLDINDPNLLLSSPLTMPLKTFSPTKAQQSSPTRSSPLKYSATGSPQGFLGDETMGGSSFSVLEGDYNRINEPDDDEEGEEEYEDQEVFGYGEVEAEAEENESEHPKAFPATGGEEEVEDENGDFDTTIDESGLFKLAEKAKLGDEAEMERKFTLSRQNTSWRKVKGKNGEEEDVITETHQRNVLTSRVSDFEVSCLEQVHPEIGQTETCSENAQVTPTEQEAETIKGERRMESKDVAGGDLTFSDCVEESDDIPSSPVLDITSPIKFEYRPTNEIFPARESDQVEDEDQRIEPFSPIDMDFFSNRSFDTSAADWQEDEDEEDEEDEEEEDEEPNVNSPGGRLRHFRASSPPNIWSVKEQPNTESLDSEAPASPVPGVVMPWDESGFDFSEEFIRPPSGSPEPSDEHSFGFSKQSTPEELAADDAEKVPSPAADYQFPPSAAGNVSPVTFEAGGSEVRPIAKSRKSGAKTDTWLGKKGLQPKEEKGKVLSTLEKPVGEEDMTEMKGGKRMLETKGDEERTKRIRKDTDCAPESSQAPVFLLPPKSDVEREGGEKERRQTFGGKPMARATGALKRRKSFPEGPTVPDRQSYLYASDPERISRHWAEYEKDQATLEPAIPNSPPLPITADPTEAGPSGDDSQHSVLSSQTPPQPRRLRSGFSAAASPSAVSGPSSSPPSSGQGKRKAVEPLDTGRDVKSSIPVSRRLARRPFNSKTQEEVSLVKKNTEHNALYSCKLDYEPIQMSGKRPPSLDHNEIRRLSAEARRKRSEAEEQGLTLRPGEDEAFVAEEQGEKKRVKWDDQLEYGYGSDVSEKSRSRPEYLPNKGILAVKPPLNVHGNWVPTPGAPPLELPQELVVVKKIVYRGEDTEGKGGKK